MKYFASSSPLDYDQVQFGAWSGKRLVFKKGGLFVIRPLNIFLIKKSGQLVEFIASFTNLAVSLGRGISIFLSKRPGLSKAGSKVSGRLVAMIILT